MKNLLLVLFISFSLTGTQLLAQPSSERIIKGIVIDEYKEPIFYASVIVKNLKTGTLTDFDGRFQLTIPDSCEVLKIIYVGYLSQEVNIKGKDSITVVLTGGVVLTEAVVIDYKVPLIECDNTTTGGIKTAEQIRNLPVKNINNIAATTAGLPSIDGGDVSIRGSRSDATNYIVDGIRVSSSFAVASHESRTDDLAKTKSPAAKYSAIKNTYSSGQLTAGEINDFGKWGLWNDKTQQELTEYRKAWNIYPLNRYMVILQNTSGIPITGQTMYLLDDKKNIVWTAKTDNTGKAELWSNMFEETYSDDQNFSIVTTMDDIDYCVPNAQRFEKGANHLTIKSKCNLSNVVDAVFVVDATGSMSDEIKYLQEELTDVVRKVKARNKELTLNLGCVFYRDHGDEYVTRMSELSSNISNTFQFIQNQTAGGGGDEPEALDEALEMAVRNMKWNSDSRTKLLFVVMDASPHQNTENLNRIRDITLDAAKQGIKIIPLTASGINKSAEYLMRSLALCTNGTYVFLTNHSGIGNPHLEPTTDTYDVETLNDLLIRLFDQNISVVNCSEKQNRNLLIMTDTVESQNMPLIVAGLSQHALPSERQNEKAKIEFTYYPNPTTGLLNIEIKGKIQELFLCDISGKLLQRFEVNGDSKLQLDISPYPIGTYRIMYFESDNLPRSGMVVLAQ